MKGVMSNLLALVASSVLLLAAGGVVRAGPLDEVVYDNSVHPAGWTIIYGVRGLQIGDEVTLGGTSRFVTQIDLSLSGLTRSDTTVRLWANDGPDGFPHTLLFETTIRNVLYNGHTTLSVPVPAVAVPDTLTWTVAFDSVIPVGVRYFDPPTVGSSDPTFAWVGYYPPFTNYFYREYFHPPGVAANYGARIIATPTPEPGGLILLASGTLSLLGYGGYYRKERPSPSAR
jgi:hypothetical protein